MAGKKLVVAGEEEGGLDLNRKCYVVRVSFTAVLNQYNGACSSKAAHPCQDIELLQPERPGYPCSLTQLALYPI